MDSEELNKIFEMILKQYGSIQAIVITDMEGAEVQP